MRHKSITNLSRHHKIGIHDKVEHYNIEQSEYTSTKQRTRGVEADAGGLARVILYMNTLQRTP